MSQKKYQHYQAAEGSWFTQIPTHWEMLSSNRVFEQKREPAVADDEQLSVTQKYGVMPQNLFMAMDDRKVTLALAGTDNFKHVDEGDFVISLRSFEGGIELSQYKGCISPAYTCLRARKPIGEGYYKFTMKSKDFISALQSVTQGIRDGKNISYAEFSKLSIPYPPVEEQTAIARFLDRETAKIDALVAEQQRLIELLQEKRQAVISHAVTKGLNPNAPMKDSGVEWLGEVPEHWNISPLNKLISKITNGYVGPTRDILQDEGVRYLQSLHIKNNSIVFDTPYYVSEEWSQSKEKSILKSGDVLIVQTGDIGQSAVVPPEFEGCNCHALIIVSPVREILNGEWLSWVFNSAYGRETLLSIQTGALHPHLNCGNVKFIHVPIPPLSEQMEICRFIARENMKSDELLMTANSLIRLQAERRSALISAAVTGQIDVRGLVEAEAAGDQ